ncbi:MAG TPA: FecR domain-containing protein [Chryseosolibacter sp.]
MNTDRLRFLFEKYVTNTISEQERSEFFQLVSNADADEEVKKMLEELWNSLPEENFHVNISNDVYSNVIGPTRDTDTRAETKFPWLKVAAAFALVTVASAALFVYRSLAPVAPSTVSQETTSAKHESFIRLPDGSTVVLHAGSALHYPDSFEGKKTREVYLDGEGYFDVKHDSEHPFIVHAGNVITKVLGTSFNVKAFANDEEIVVTVTRGKVQVSNSQKVLGIVGRDQQITVNKTTINGDIKNVDTQDAVSWMERDILFDNVTMEEAVVELENRFNVRIELLDDKIKKCRFTATFIKGEDLEQILLVICEFNNVTFRQTEVQIEIDGKGCE